MKTSILRVTAIALVAVKRVKGLPGSPGTVLDDLITRANPEVDSIFKCVTNYSGICPACNQIVKTRKPWTWLTEDEKTSYLDAELCLLNSPTQIDISNMGVNETTQTRWDDLHYIHIYMTNDVHSVGHVMDMRTQTLCSEYEFGAW